MIGRIDYRLVAWIGSAAGIRSNEKTPRRDVASFDASCIDEQGYYSTPSKYTSTLHAYVHAIIESGAACV